MVLQSLFPVFALIALGNLLKHIKLTSDSFLRTSDRLVYFIFFPLMLFWKIGGASTSMTINWNLCFAAICSVFLLYLLSMVYIKFAKVSHFKAGSFSQSCYRFNTYIGMAIIINALGEAGVRQFGVLIGFAIPFINVMAVSTLIWFSNENYAFAERIRLTLKALVSNPLIIACVAGILYSRFQRPFPVFLANTFQLASLVTLPLALISIGGGLTFKSLKGDLKLSFAASVFKLLALPAVGYFFLNMFAVTGLSFKVGMIFFALPTSTAIYVLSSQLNSDTELASAAIMLSTLLSFVFLTLVLVM